MVFRFSRIWGHVPRVRWADVLELAGVALVVLLSRVPFSFWPEIGGSAGLTLARVLIVVGAGTLWTVPVGLWIGLSPRGPGRRVCHRCGHPAGFRAVH